MLRKILIVGLGVLSMLSFMGCSNGIQNQENNVIVEDNKVVQEDVQENETVHNDGQESRIAQEEKSYHFPHEGLEHEGTWLQWPHDYTYNGVIHVYEPIWIEMTRGLVKGENVHLIVYNEEEKKRVKNVLEKENIDMSKVDFYVFPTDDVWVRDNGPIFAYDEDNNLVIQNWKFNGWGDKAPYTKDDAIPTKISEAIGIKKVDIDMVMEGGALEFDGNGTVMSTLSCVANDNRTSDFTLEEIEAYITKYYGVTNFIWLNGVAGMDITDNHIDGVMKFLDDKTIITTTEYDKDHPDFLGYDEDVKTLLSAKNINGEPYDYVFLPATKNNVVEVKGEKMKGSYMNFYVGNKVVLVPNYEDENDKVANAMIQELYPGREVVGIDVRDLFADGGMIHCVTQQQPVSIRK